MQIETLITLLEELAQEHPGAEVRLMNQSNWPFEYSLQGVTTTSEMDQADAEDEGPEASDEVGQKRDEKEDIIYLVEGTQLGYGRKTAWTTCTC